MELYGYWRSSAAYRVRIAIHLKGLEFDYFPVNLVREGGEHRLPEYAQLNPQKLVPALELDNGKVLTQSLAIIEYLDEIFPEVPLLPENPELRAQVRGFAQVIACDVHPLNNLRVLEVLQRDFNMTEAQKMVWIERWIHDGFAALEAMIQETHGTFCFGDTVTLADVFLVPQMYNARRFNIELSRYPLLCAIDRACVGLEAFQRASPEQQPDAVK